MTFSCFRYRKTFICREFTGYWFHDVHDNSNRCDEILVWDWYWEGMGIIRWDWEGNGNKTSLSLEMRIGMNNWEREGLGLKKTFQLISTQWP